ncbi:MAG TPA: hypothetical protein VM597_40135 [Gemmataceae bacterium]|jgi:hypothetical protein|nr:hypothetical protein [Gemmataceae bacterium]
MTTVKFKVRFERGGKGGRTTAEVDRRDGRAVPSARVPRVARLMALAIRFDGLLRDGTVNNYADLAGLGGVTRARITQVMNLLHLAPDLQAELLQLTGAAVSRRALTLADVQPVCRELHWRKQRKMWADLGKRADVDG